MLELTLNWQESSVLVIDHSLWSPSKTTQNHFKELLQEPLVDVNKMRSLKEMYCKHKISYLDLKNQYPKLTPINI